MQDHPYWDSTSALANQQSRPTGSNMIQLAKDRPLIMPILLAGSVISIGLLIYLFGNFREEQAVRKCMEALKSEDLISAYQLWGPTEEYTYQDFLKDWGEQGYYGQVKHFHILRSKWKGSGVIVMVQINNLRKPIAFWVERKTRTIGFSPTDL